MQLSTVTIPALSIYDRTQEYYHIRLDSVQDAMTCPIAPKQDHDMTRILDRDASIPWDSQGKKWYGVDTRSELLDILNGKGWEEGAAKVMSAFGELQDLQIDAPRTRKRVKTWGDDGEHIDIDRLRNGQYESCWQRTRRADRAQPGRVIRIFASFGGHAGENAEDIFWTGAAALFLIDSLESAGYRAEVFAAKIGKAPYEGTAKANKDILTTTQVKRADEPANADQLAATLCLAGFYRTAILRAYYATPQRIAGHHGSGKDTTPEVLTAAQLFTPGDVIIPTLRDRDSAARFIRQTFGKIDNPEQGEGTAAEEYTPARYADPVPLPTPTPAPLPTPTPAPDGPKIEATGDTYPVKRALREAGFHWNRAVKCWSADKSDARAAALVAAGLPGVIFTEK